MYKDWDANPERFKRSEFPAWSLETVKFLVEKRGVTAIGHESMDTDTTDKMESETYILQQGHFQIEVMANLDQLPAKGALIVVTWPKVQGCSTLCTESVMQQWLAICGAGQQWGFLWEKSSESMTASAMAGGCREVVRPLSFTPRDDPRPTPRRG
jgi:hypothetical protein